MSIIRLLDFETTSLTPDTGSVIEVGTVDYNVTDRTIADPQSYLCHADSIPPENRAVHHIMPSLLIGREPFSADKLNDDAEADGIACWAAHNASFETAWFTPRIPMICTYKSALRAWPDAPSHSNQALRYWLEDAGRMDGFNYAHARHPHRAPDDAYVTAWILRNLFEDGHTGRQMIQWTREPAALPRCPLGSDKGKPWAEVDAGLLRWIIGKPDLSDDVRHCAQAELDRRSS